MTTQRNRKTRLAGLTSLTAVAILLAAGEAAAQHYGDRLARHLARAACHSVDRFQDCGLISVEQDTLEDGSRRTQYLVQVGAGEFDTITIHRVSVERRGRLRRALMLLPGTGLDVENLYLPRINSEAVPDDYSPLIYAAQRGIDAWSMDYRGSDLPAGIEDYGFMADWGLATATTDAQLAMKFARLVRLFEGDGYRRIHVGGYSAGVSVAFSVASRDAARHQGRRDVRGIVVVDDAFDTDPATSQGACMALEMANADLAMGNFIEDLSFLNLIGGFAKADPYGPTPFGPPGFTNLQFFNLVVTSPSGPEPFHIFGGAPGEDGFPAPAFTPQNLAIDQGILFEPALPLVFSRDLSAIRCSAEPVSELDGGLPGVRVPVLHVGAAGGNANAIDYTLSQIGSTDITTMLVRKLSPGEEAFDYGHGDVFAATDAAAEVWQPIVDWIKRH